MIYKDYLMRQVALFARYLGKILFQMNRPGADIEVLDYQEAALGSKLLEELQILLAAQNYNEGETLIFQRIAEEPSQENLAAALCFYQALLMLMPEDLAAADFSMEEIEEGLADLAKIYDFQQV